MEDETRSIPTLASKFLFYLPFLTARLDTPRLGRMPAATQKG
jgi:hypothetical protein